MTDARHSALMETVSELLDWARVSPFAARFTQSDTNGTSSSDVAVNPRTGAWRTRDIQTGRSLRYSPETHLIYVNDEEDGQPASDGQRPQHQSVRMAFPLSLDIWGRRSDSFRPVDVERSGGEAILLLRHRTEPAIYGSARLDTSRGLLTAVQSPLYSWAFQDVALPKSPV